jgi:hypothetical protein
MSATSDPRRAQLSDVGTEYYYRRRLSTIEVLKAAGVGIGAGLLAFYISTIVMERTPLRPERRPRSTRPRPVASEGVPVRRG